MRYSLFSLLCLIFFFAQGITAQIATSLSLNKKTYVAGEPVIAEVIITNHSGRDLTLASTRQSPWLSFVVNSANGTTVPTRRLNNFGALQIKVGQSMAKQVDLTEFFILDSQGNFSVSAVVRDTRTEIAGKATNRLLFNLYPGRTYWTQTVGVSDGSSGSAAREMRLLTISSGQKTQLYAQVTNKETGMKIRTFPLGNALMMRRPMVSIDGAQRMHVMFLATPTMWVHCQVSTDAKLVARDIHQRGSQGDPVLMAYGDGSVRVVNSIPYRPQAVQKQKEKVRKASDRPDF